jgi:hypothetical protein
MALITILYRLLILRAKPHDIPYSKVLLAGLAIAVFAIKVYAHSVLIALFKTQLKDLVVHLSVLRSGLIVLLYFLVLIACLRTTLSIYKIPGRFVQVASNLLWVDLVVAALFILWLYSLFAVSLPLQFDSISAFAIILVFILLMYWQFLLYINIFVNSMPVSVLRAGVFALVYLMLQHNLADILINMMIQMDDKTG